MTQESPASNPDDLTAAQVRATATDRECLDCGHWARHHGPEGCTVIAGTADSLGDSPCPCTNPPPEPKTAARRSWWRRLRDRIDSWLDETERLRDMQDDEPADSNGGSDA